MSPTPRAAGKRRVVVVTAAIAGVSVAGAVGLAVVAGHGTAQASTASSSSSGDIATAGPAPEGGWRVLVRDTAQDPQAAVTLAAGAALATSSTVSRRWRRQDGVGGRPTAHHVLDPRSGAPVAAVWRTVSVAGCRPSPLVSRLTEHASDHLVALARGGRSD